MKRGQPQKQSSLHGVVPRAEALEKSLPHSAGAHSLGKNSSETILPESYNSHYGGLLREAERRILEYIDSIGFEETPKDIATKLGMNHNSVKVYLRRLLERNFVYQPHRGYYASKKNLVTLDTHPGGRVTGVSEVALPKIHNIRLKIEGLIGVGLVREIELGSASATVTGSENDVANVMVDCYPGVSLDYAGFKLLMASLRNALSVPKNAPIYVTSFELNHDFAGIQLDGCKSMTLRAFDGSFERLYNKYRNVVRREVRPVGKTSPEAISALLRGGVTGYNLLQLVSLLINEIRGYTEAQKYTNRILSDLLHKLGRRECKRRQRAREKR